VDLLETWWTLLVDYTHTLWICCSLYVDDCLAIGIENDTNESIESLKEYDFVLKIEVKLIGYLSCQIHVDKETEMMFLMQRILIKNWRNNFKMK
jgi:hypothetical protein